MGPGRAAVVAPEEPGRLDAGVDRAVRRGDVPDRRDLRAVVAVGQTLRGMAPRGPEVVAPEDGRSVPRRAAAGVDRTGRRVPLEVVDRPPVAQRLGHLPGAAIGAAIDDEARPCGCRRGAACGSCGSLQFGGRRPSDDDRAESSIDIGTLDRPGSVARLERVDDPAVGRRRRRGPARPGTTDVRRLVVEDGGRRDAAGLADALGDRVDRRAAVPDLVDDQDPLAAQQRVGRELEERRVRAGLALVVVVLDGGDEDVPDPRAGRRASRRGRGRRG